MTVTEALRSRLVGLTAVTDLVSTRVYDQHLPQSPTLPAVLLSLIDESQPMQLRGVSGFVRARVQIDAVAQAASGVDALASARAIEAAIHGAGDGSALAGWAGTVSTLTITGIQPLDRREGYAPDEMRQFRVSRDYYVFHRG